MQAQATIHHMPNEDRRRGGARTTPPPGVLHMPGAEEKLDRLVTMLSDVRVDVAKLTATNDARDRDIEQLRTEVENLRARPQGLTGRSLLIALASTASGAAALVTVLDKVHIG